MNYSDQDSTIELICKLQNYYNLNRSDLACLYGVHKSIIDGWLSGKKKPGYQDRRLTKLFLENQDSVHSILVNYAPF